MVVWTFVDAVDSVRLLDQSIAAVVGEVSHLAGALWRHIWEEVFDLHDVSRDLLECH